MSGRRVGCGESFEALRVSPLHDNLLTERGLSPPRPPFTRFFTLPQQCLTKHEERAGRRGARGGGTSVEWPTKMDFDALRASSVS
jgi:hypothetical protein